jgi:hypothetical protein
MLNEKTCLCCTQSLAHRRPQTKTCSGKCRSALSRKSRAKPISLKIVLSKIQYESLKHQAGAKGCLINQLVIARAMAPITNAGATL